VDLVLRNAHVVDGTGSAAIRADVGIDGGRIAVVGYVGPGAAAEVDLDGLVLAPGFIDAHTHYDAQVLWDPDLSPSCWHGVTSVVVGNCGFGIAPTRPHDRLAIMQMLEHVEGMPFEALHAGIPWSFETFPEYLDVIEGMGTRLNVAAYVGHTPVRTYVMGDQASVRVATPEERAQMASLVRDAMEAGAIGFSTSGSPTHFGGGGAPVPSRLADYDEFLALGLAVRESGHGVIDCSPGPDLHLSEFAELAKRTGRPITWAGALTEARTPGSATAQVDASRAGPGEVWPQITCRPLTVQVSLEDPYAFNQVEAFREVLDLPVVDRAGRYADPDWRARARDQVEERWGDRLGLATVQSEAADGTIVTGPTLSELATDAGIHPLDVMVERSLAEGLTTRFRVVLINDGQDELDELLRRSDTLLALSDAGAHSAYLCDADYSTHLLADYVRERGALTLEHAIWRLSGQPAEILGLHDRGRIAPGRAADLVAFDPERITSSTPARVRDLPAGAGRIVVRSHGIQHVWVNGIAIRSDGIDRPGVRPGHVLRGKAAHARGAR
jgi:N-acyl-D-aspartate/D-glutamate deacylase